MLAKLHISLHLPPGHLASSCSLEPNHGTVLSILLLFRLLACVAGNVHHLRDRSCYIVATRTVMNVKQHHRAGSENPAAPEHERDACTD